MREIVHLQAGQCGNQIGAKVSDNMCHFRTLLSCIIYDQRVFLHQKPVHCARYVPEATPWEYQRVLLKCWLRN